MIQKLMQKQQLLWHQQLLQLQNPTNVTCHRSEYKSYGLWFYQDICTFKLGVRTGILMLPKLFTACITSFASANYKIKKHNDLKSDGME